MAVAYPLRIELRHFKPAIYRDVRMDPATPLPKRHKWIQAAMGWEDAHLHGFALPLRNESDGRIPGIRRFDEEGDSLLPPPEDRCDLERRFAGAAMLPTR